MIPSPIRYPPKPQTPALPPPPPPLPFHSSPLTSNLYHSAARASSSPSGTTCTSNSSASFKRPHTISGALRARHLENPPEAYAEWAPYLKMTSRFLGHPPSFYPVLSLSHAAIRTHVGLFARMFHCPQTDMRIPGFLSPELRRLAFVAASDAFACDYCLAHSFIFGDMLRGSIADQIRRGKGDQAQTPIHPDDPRLNDQQRAVIVYAHAAVQRPYRPPIEGEDRATLVDLAADVEKFVGSRGMECVNATVAFSGALNTLVDVQGVTAEPSIQAFASLHLPTADDDEWSINDHHRNDDTDTSTELWGGEEPDLMGLKGKAENMRELLCVMPAAMSGMKYEMFQLYEGIPSRTTKLYRWLEERLGEEHCAWFRQIQGTELKRAFCFGLRENMLVEDGAARAWTLSARVCFLYLFARVTESAPLAEMAVALMPTDAIQDDGLEPRRQLSRFVRCSSDELFPAVAMGRRLVFATAVKTANISPDLVEDCTENCSPEALMELASLLSFFEMWRRMCLLFSRTVYDQPLEIPLESPLKSHLMKPVKTVKAFKLDKELPSI